jgi:hypothetical protein
MSYQSDHTDDRGSKALSTTARHELLAKERRRTVLSLLNEGELPVELDSLTERVAAEGEPAQKAPGTERAVRTSLHHVHLPKLDDAGVLDYDSETNRVESYEPLQ